jgi:hypothetical protein
MADKSALSADEKLSFSGSPTPFQEPSAFLQLSRVSKQSGNDLSFPKLE